jgi:hypothetical protein
MMSAVDEVDLEALCRAHSSPPLEEHILSAPMNDGRFRCTCSEEAWRIDELDEFHGRLYRQQRWHMSPEANTDEVYLRPRHRYH